MENSCLLLPKTTLPVDSDPNSGPENVNNEQKESKNLGRVGWVGWLWAELGDNCLWVCHLE